MWSCRTSPSCSWSRRSCSSAQVTYGLDPDALGDARRENGTRGRRPAPACSSGRTTRPLCGRLGGGHRRPVLAAPWRRRPLRSAQRSRLRGGGRAAWARSACQLYHSALASQTSRSCFEMTPVLDECGDQRGVVAEGAVGGRSAGRLRIFRYEIRRSRGGAIPDVDEAVQPRRLTDDHDLARRVLELVPRVPTPVWGRDDLETGEMWNSNSVTSWLIARSGIDTESIQPPAGGRAPGWRAGLVIARRQELDAAPVRAA